MIPLARPYFDNAELDEVKKVLDSRWVAQGPKCKEFEEKFAAYIGTKYAVSLSNCTTALHLALVALGIKAGDEVLVSDFTFPATGNAVLYTGAKPVFVDVQTDTYNMDPSDLEKKITKRSKAVIVVHAFGNPADMDRILAIARKHKLKVIEDAACAHGATYRGKKIGTLADIACFSFHARKNMTTGEGGMITTDNKELADHIRKLATHGIDTAWKREETDEFTVPIFNELGYNYRLSDISSAVGIAQLAKLENLIEKRRALAEHYDKRLAKLGFVSAPVSTENAEHIYQSYVPILSKEINRNKLIMLMKNKGVQITIGTYASHVQPVYETKQACPNSLDIFQRTIALPMFFELTTKDIDFVVDALEYCVKILNGETT